MNKNVFIGLVNNFLPCLEHVSQAITFSWQNLQIIISKYFNFISIQQFNFFFFCVSRVLLVAEVVVIIFNVFCSDCIDSLLKFSLSSSKTSKKAVNFLQASGAHKKCCCTHTVFRFRAALAFWIAVIRSLK